MSLTECYLKWCLVRDYFIAFFAILLRTKGPTISRVYSSFNNSTKEQKRCMEKNVNQAQFCSPIVYIDSDILYLSIFAGSHFFSLGIWLNQCDSKASKAAAKHLKHERKWTRSCLRFTFYNLLVRTIFTHCYLGLFGKFQFFLVQFIYMTSTYWNKPAFGHNEMFIDITYLFAEKK